jgi:hypothetical protein
MTTHDEHAKRYQDDRWVPKTKMQTAADDLPVVRVELPEHFSTEPDYATSMQQIPPMPYHIQGPVRNLATVARLTSANTVDRDRARSQLLKMAADGDAQAEEALKYI